MLYGKQTVQNEILSKVKEFEKNYNKKVIFGSMVGSISKGVERYDSDYDTRFLYLDLCNQSGYIRWDKIEDIQERQIHQCYFPTDQNHYYDKIAYWELTSFIKFLVNPQLDNKFSIGLYHIVGWTFNSPFCWDPYGIKSKISCLLDEMFVLEYEVQYYRNYIHNALKRESLLLREYLYSVYYALAIEYCVKNEKFAPVYFKSLLAMCNDENLVHAILELEEEYYSSVSDIIRNGDKYERKMTNSFNTIRNDTIDSFLNNMLERTNEYPYSSQVTKDVGYVEKIINIILDSLERPIVKDVNE